MVSGGDQGFTTIECINTTRHIEPAKHAKAYRVNKPFHPLSAMHDKQIKYT